MHTLPFEDSGMDLDGHSQALTRTCHEVSLLDQRLIVSLATGLQSDGRLLAD